MYRVKIHQQTINKILDLANKSSDCVSCSERYACYTTINHWLVMVTKHGSLVSICFNGGVKGGIGSLVDRKVYHDISMAIDAKNRLNLVFGDSNTYIVVSDSCCYGKLEENIKKALAEIRLRNQTSIPRYLKKER